MNTPRPRPSKSPASGGVTTVRNTARTSSSATTRATATTSCVFDSERSLAIRDLEARLRQGKLTFASPERMERWLGLRPGSVSPFGLINDPENHVHLFLDVNLRDCPAYSFHPNDNRATVVIPQEEFLKYLAAVGNSYEFIELY